MPDRLAPDMITAFEHAPMSMSVSDPHGRILFGNNKFWSLLGFDRDAEMNVGMMSRPDDQDWTRSYITRLIIGEIDEFGTFKRFVRADGSEFDGHLALAALRSDGRCTGIIGCIDPLNVRPTSNDARLRKLLERAAGTTSLIEVDGTVVETSGRYRGMLGYPKEFWEERSILDVLVPDDLPTVIAMRDQVLADPSRPAIGDVRVQNADRSIETIEVTALNMLDDEDLSGVVLSTRNVTVERRNMRAVAQLRDDAVAKAEERSHLLATVSHELRNPLHAMSGIVELIASDEALSGDTRELAGTLVRQLRHLTTVTDDLLDTARMEVGRFELRPTPASIRDIISDVVRVARSAADGRLDVIEAVADDVPQVVTVDPARLQQILGNLIGNAVKFTEHGSVTLSVSVDSTSAPTDLLVFEVRDTGVGIPPEQTEQVFKPFSTASTSGDRRGAGLGLAIVQRLVEALGGRLELRSILGEGSTFTATIPAIDAIHQRLATKDETTPVARPASILVVEDTPVNQELARHQLARLGMDCTIAGSAEIGIDLLATDTFDVILMDHQLPGMNGRDATREIRRQGITTPIVGITASSTAADERACLDAGMDAFLPKPVGLEQLSAVLESILGGDSPTARAGLDTTIPDDAVDVSVLDRLADELGDRGIVASLVNTFLGELDARESDVAGDDDVLAARQAHTLKSSAKLLGANHLSQVCAEAETDTAARRRIVSAAAAARTGLRAWLDSPDDADPTTPEAVEP